jgi:hypothetical protein
VTISVPIKGCNREGELKIKAYTRDDRWILSKAWMEDDDMIIEIKKRLTMKYFEEEYKNPTDHFVKGKDSLF